MSANQDPVSLKRFMLQALLWLPLSFFVWFLWSGIFVAPVDWLTGLVLQLWSSESFNEVLRTGYQLEVEVFIELPAEMVRIGQGRPVAAIPVNPMIYGYGFPLLAGLAISTPRSVLLRALQIAAGYLAIVLVQTWGVVFETLKTLHFQLGDEGKATVQAIGISADLTALGYQFGYLILPGVVPIALWILMNRSFIEGLIPAWHLAGRGRPTPEPTDSPENLPETSIPDSSQENTHGSSPDRADR